MADGKQASLKSSYDLAMERLAACAGRVKPLSAGQKAAIAEVERKCMAKIAELEIMLKTRLARAGDDAEKIEQLQNSRQAESAKIRAAAEEEKESIRNPES